MAALLAWMQVCSAHYGIEPEFVYAVARIESGVPGGPRIRIGPLGRKRKYYGPMGINRCFLARWPVDNCYVNVMVGARALRGRDKRRILKRYNASFDEAYYQAIMACYRQAKRERVFDHGPDG